MWTLTFKVAQLDRAAVVKKMRWFVRRLQAAYGRMPIVAVIERGRRGTRRLHVHLAVDRWLNHEVLESIWGHGFVWVGDPGKLPGQVTVRHLSRYLAKYVAKDYENDSPEQRDRDQGQHRYLITQGWCPPTWRRRFPRAAAALAWLMAAYGTPDVIMAFGEDTPDELHGYWLSFPDGCLWDPPQPT